MSQRQGPAARRGGAAQPREDVDALPAAGAARDAELPELRPQAGVHPGAPAENFGPIEPTGLGTPGTHQSRLMSGRWTRGGTVWHLKLS